MRSEEMLKKINALNAKDLMVQEILNAIGANLDSGDEKIQQTNLDLFFDTCSEKVLNLYENELGITPSSSQSISDRRSAVAAKWKSDGKVDIALLQAVADSWKNGKTSIDFASSKIQITFIDQFGLPQDLAGLEKALDEAKPAHLSIEYIVRYLMLVNIEAMTLQEMQGHFLSDFSFE